MSSKQEKTQRLQQAPKNDTLVVQGDAFVKHLEYASTVVSTWPVWKQQILGGQATSPPAQSVKAPATDR